MFDTPKGGKVRRPRSSCFPHYVEPLDKGTYVTELDLGDCHPTVFLDGKLVTYHSERVDSNCYSVTALIYSRFRDNCGNVWWDTRPYTFRHCCEPPFTDYPYCKNPSQVPSGPTIPPEIPKIPPWYMTRGLEPEFPLRQATPDEFAPSPPPAHAEATGKYGSYDGVPSEINEPDHPGNTVEKAVATINSEHPGAMIEIVPTGQYHRVERGAVVPLYDVVFYVPSDYTPGDEGVPPAAESYDWSSHPSMTSD